jgi:hypothetical protein
MSTHIRPAPRKLCTCEGSGAGLNGGGKSAMAKAIDEAGGLVITENLQHHEDNGVYEQAYMVLEFYFDDDGAEKGGQHTEPISVAV